MVFNPEILGLPGPRNIVIKQVKNEEKEDIGFAAAAEF